VSTVLNPGHADRPVLQVTEHGRTLIRKRYRTLDDAERVFAATTALWRSPFGAGRMPPGLPEPLAFDRAATTVDTAFLVGEAGHRGVPDGCTPHDLDGMGLLLADLHRSGVDVPLVRSARRVLASMRRTLGDEHPIVSLAAARTPEDELLVPSHGDFTPRNVWCTADGPVLIDLDRVQQADPSRDLGHFAAWCWTRRRLEDDPDGWRSGDALEAAYLRHADVAAADLDRGRAFHRAAGLVRCWASVSKRQPVEVAGALLAEAARLLTAD
jgi:hypothetical protein